MSIHHHKGITLLELLMVLAIMAIIAAVVMPNLSNFRKEQILTNTAQDIVSLLNNARNNTIASLNSTNYGVHFETTRAVYFVGGTYNSGDSTNIPLAFDSSVEIASSGGINLNGGGSNVVFARLTGDTTSYGTIVIRLVSNTARQKTITINKTGSLSSN